jgi:hypothetical protein
MINKIKLSTPYTDNIWYTFNNNGIQHQSFAFAELALYTIVASSKVKETKLRF